MAITPKVPGTIDPPNTVTAESEGGVAIPNTVTAEAAGTVAIPNTLTAESEGAVSIPNSLTAESVVNVAVPNTLTAESVGSVAIPNTVTPQDAAAFPRTFIPRLDLDFKNGLFSQSGTSKALSDLVTYSRNSAATFLDRFLDSNGDWNYFVNTNWVGGVTNKFTYSEQFDHADWTKTSSSITANNAIDPNGGRTADKIEATDPSGGIAPRLKQAFTSIASTSYTFSVYAKKDIESFIQLSFATGEVTSNPHINFDLNTGVIGLKDPNIDSASITPVGNDWYRISATVVAVGTTLTPDIIVVKTASDTRVQSNTDFTIGEGLYIWGASVTATSTLTPYVKTISAEASETFTETLRIEYDAATGESLGALIESASTNLCLRSEEFDNASWTKSDSTISENDTLGPDNSTSADKLEAGSSASIQPYTTQTVTSSIAASYTTSAYVKRSEASFVQILFGGSEVANNPRVNFDLSTGVIGSQDADIDSASIIPVGNDWFRISATVVAAQVTMTPLFALAQSATDTRLEANSWTSGQGLYIWGAQIEAKEAPTSYIRTGGSTVSRLADLESAPIAGNMPTGDYTIFANVRSRSEVQTNSNFIYNIDTDAEDRNAFLNSSGDLGINPAGGITVAAVGTFEPSYTVATVFNKSANTLTGFLNGVQTVTADAGSAGTPTISGVIGIGNTSPVAASQLNGHIKQLTIIDKALTAQEVALL